MVLSLRFRRTAVLFVVLVTLSSCSTPAPSPESKLSIHFIDVEQGSCILIVSPSGVAALVDAGSGQSGGSPSDADPVDFISTLEREDPSFDLRYVVASHYDADHIGKLDEVLQAGLLSAGGVIYDRGDPQADSDTLDEAAFKAYKSAASAKIRRSLSPRSAPLDLGAGVTLRCYAADGVVLCREETQAVALPANEENDRSIAMVLEFGDIRIWLGGDLGERIERALSPYASDVDVYVVHHHGSKESSSSPFLGALRPEFAICQSGETNTYGHPNEEAVRRILGTSTTSGGHSTLIQQNRGNPTDARSDDALAFAIADPDGVGGAPGTISITTDGHNLTVTWPSGSVGLLGAATVASTRPELPPVRP